MKTEQNDLKDKVLKDTNPDIKRVVGFILYHQGKVTDSSCDVCVRVAERETSNLCVICKCADSKPNWKEVKTLLQADWDEREYDFPWEEYLPIEVAAFLDKLNYSIGGTK